MRNERESIIGVASGESSQPNQSKSIKYLWRELLGRIDDVHNAHLDSNEREIVDKIQQIRRNLETDEILVICGEETSHNRASDIDACRIAQRPVVEWERSNEDSITGNSFTSLLFKQPQPSRLSQIPKITSSIMNMARGEQKPSEENQDTLMKKLLLDPAAPDVEVVALPRTIAASIKDSMDVIDRRVS
jgi:hypothetical protein